MKHTLNLCRHVRLFRHFMPQKTILHSLNGTENRCVLVAQWLIRYFVILFHQNVVSITPFSNRLGPISTYLFPLFAKGKHWERLRQLIVKIGKIWKRNYFGRVIINHIRTQRVSHNYASYYKMHWKKAVEMGAPSLINNSMKIKNNFSFSTNILIERRNIHYMSHVAVSIVSPFPSLDPKFLNQKSFISHIAIKHPELHSLHFRYCYLQYS